MAATSHSSSHGSNAHSSNVVGVHYRVGKKIGEGSFGVIFEGQNLLNNQQVAIKFVLPERKVIIADALGTKKE
jgi:casein kinase 1